MGIGPSLAIPKILEKTGLRLEEVDVIEINEAFASMVSWIRDISNGPRPCVCVCMCVRVLMGEI
jgi:acetyl-CoA acetyltransferase